MISTRPYLLRAFYDWIVDNNFTPYIVIDAEALGEQIPDEYIEDGRIVLNVSPSATHNLQLGNDVVEFSASFSGKVCFISAKLPAILAIYAKENGRGMVFGEDEEDGDNGGGDTPPSSNGDDKAKKPTLRVVK
ncbi:MAG: ClpXP protease specificity-enhancing factor [Legionellales bacterium]|nr:ClpXP protease specificity-enhancing factor [Legionellales bacterium]|tara:strand:+ start:5510 stop:5908 length:399 start_codon:yes stop_codon:yes gene_type:complete